MDEDKTYTITLSDGTKIENLKLSGTNFVSQDEVTEDMFNGKLSTVTISDGKNEEIHKRGKLVVCEHYPEGYYFAFVFPTKYELEQQKIRSDIDYIAVVSDIELDEE